MELADRHTLTVQYHATVSKIDFSWVFLKKLLPLIKLPTQSNNNHIFFTYENISQASGLPFSFAKRDGITFNILERFK